MAICGIYSCWGTALVLVFALLPLPLPAQNGQTREDTGFFGDDISIPCSSSTPGTIKSVRWADHAYKMTVEPITIWDNGKFNTDHSQKGGFEVSDDYTLKILKLVADDAGEYDCTITHQDDSVETHKTLLKVIEGNPKCEPVGGVSVHEGADVDLTCTLGFGGTSPPVAWKNSTSEVVSGGFPMFGTIRKTANVKATYLMDKEIYRCAVTVTKDGMTKELDCQVPFSVTYKAQDLKCEPEQEEYHPGDTVRCSAKGNPTPSLVMSAPDPDETGPDYASIIITNEMIGKPVNVEFRAENKFNTAPAVKSLTLKVTERPTPPPTTPKPEPETEAPTPEPTEGQDKNTDGDSAGNTDGDPNSGGTDEQKDKEPKKGGVPITIIGAVVGVVVVIIIIVIIAVVIKKRRSNKPKGAQPVPTSDEEKLAGSKGGRSYQVEYTPREKQPLSRSPRNDYVEGIKFAPLDTSNNTNGEVWQKRTDSPTQ